MTGDDDQLVKMAVWLGSIHMETRLRPEGGRIIGEGRALHYQGGKLVKDTGWQPTGVVAYFT